MAAPTRLGVVTLAPGTSATPGAQSITVPTGATGAIAFWGDYGAFSGMTGLTCTFGTPNSANRHQTPSIGGTHNGTGLWAFDVTATGSQTITPVWSNTIVQGPALTVVFYKDLDANWKDSARFATNHNQYAAASGSVTAETDAEILVFETQDGGTAPSVPSGRTLVQNRSENAIGGVFYTVNSPAAGSNSISSGNTNFPGIAIASVKGASGGGGVTGTLSVTESGADTAAVAGVVKVQGALSVSETGNDTSAVSGTVLVAGSLAVSETGSDTAAIVGGSVATGSLNATEAGSDTAALAGSVIVEGPLSVSEVGSDTAAFAGTVLVEGDLAAAEAGSDTAALLGVVLVQGSIAVTESDADTFAATGSLSGGINGSLNATESGSDAFASSGLVVVSGVLLAGEAGTDSAVVSGAVLVQGALTVSEAGSDVFAAEGSASIRTGTLDAVESGSDSAEILGPRGSNLTQAAPGLTPKIWPGLSIRYEGKPKQRVEQLDEEERERIEEIAEQAVIDAAAESTKKAMKASLQASMRAAEIELAAKSYLHLVEQAALLRMEQIEEEDIAVTLLLM